jgi:hypothetical protein
MLVVDRDSYVRAATEAMLTGQPFDNLVDACRRLAEEEAAAKVVNLDAARARLRSSRRKTSDRPEVTI